MLVVPMVLVAEHGRPASVLYAVVRSSCPWAATASPRCFTPVITHGPKPVTVLPGLMLTSALMIPPVTQVTAVPAMMPLGDAAPRSANGVGGAVDVTVTVAVPENPPLLALTVPANVLGTT